MLQLHDPIVSFLSFQGDNLGYQGRLQFLNAPENISLFMQSNRGAGVDFTIPKVLDYEVAAVYSA